MPSIIADLGQTCENNDTKLDKASPIDSSKKIALLPPSCTVIPLKTIKFKIGVL